MPMIVAHASHWIAQVLYLAPLVLFVGILAWTTVKQRRQRASLEPGTDAGGPAAAGHER